MSREQAWNDLIYELELEQHAKRYEQMPEAQKIFSGSEAYHEALLREPPKTWSSASILLYACSLVGFLCSTMNGYDGSLSNSLLENENFVSLYHGSDSGSWASWTTYVYVVGGIVSLPFVGPSSDTWGRRWGMFIGACIVILGTVLMTTSSYDGSYGQFMGGRFALGFGVNIASAAGPMYVVEISHPAHRGVMTAFYNTWWFIGNILAAGSARGCNNLAGHISWVIPLWLQLFFPAVILIFFVFLPESPRWLYVNGQQAKAKAMLTKYHGEGNPNSAWVNLQLFEYNEFLDMDGADKRWWDYRALFRTRENLYRLFCNVTVAVFGQWAGNSVMSYFQSAAFESVGLTDQTQKMNATLGNACQQFFFAMIGARLVDVVGRRPLLLFSNIGCAIVWVAISVCAAHVAKDGGNVAAGDVGLFFMFLFGTVYSIGFTPLQALYPVEVLSFEMRAKGMAFSALCMNIASMLGFAWPIVLDRIGWYTYTIFIGWDLFQAIIIYIYIPETKNRTLEELDDIFNSTYPVKESLMKKRLCMGEDGNIMSIVNS